MTLVDLDRKIRKLLFFPFCKIIYKHFGFKSLIYKPLFLYGRKYISLGKSVNLFKGARIECISSWKGQKFNPHLIIHDNTSFEQSAHISCVNKIEIGKNCTFSARTYITDCSHSYEKIDEKVLNQKLVVKDVKIGDNCFVGMDVKIFPGVTIGDNVIIGANSIVTHDIPSYSVVVGCPAKVIKKYDFEKKEWVKVC